MTPEKAIIVLDKLNTTERIDVDREELKEAVETAKAALRKQIPYPALVLSVLCFFLLTLIFAPNADRL